MIIKIDRTFEKDIDVLRSTKMHKQIFYKKLWAEANKNKKKTIFDTKKNIFVPGKNFTLKNTDITDKL